VNVRLGNETAHVVVMVIEQMRWDPRAITAEQVMSLPEFGDVVHGRSSRGRAFPQACISAGQMSSNYLHRENLFQAVIHREGSRL